MWWVAGTEISRATLTRDYVSRDEQGCHTVEDLTITWHPVISSVSVAIPTSETLLTQQVTWVISLPAFPEKACSPASKPGGSVPTLPEGIKLDYLRITEVIVVQIDGCDASCHHAVIVSSRGPHTVARLRRQRPLFSSTRDSISTRLIRHHCLLLHTPFMTSSKSGRCEPVVSEPQAIRPYDRHVRPESGKPKQNRHPSRMRLIIIHQYYQRAGVCGTHHGPSDKASEPEGSSKGGMLHRVLQQYPEDRLLGLRPLHPGPDLILERPERLDLIDIIKSLSSGL